MTRDKSDLERLLAEVPKRTFESTLFNLAHAYARAGDASWLSLASTKDADFAAPAIMCQSFAVELLLKYFLALDHPSATNAEELETEGVKLRRHRYSELYDQLKPATAAKIAAVFGTLTGRATDAVGFRAALIAQGDDPFVFWRYVYEAKDTRHFDSALFNHVTDALGKAAEAERKARTPGK